MSFFNRFRSPSASVGPAGPVEYCLCFLGNPGSKYDGTRHNAGFMAGDLVAEALGVKLSRLKFKAVYAEAEHAGKKIVLLKPQTYMNASGESVREALAWYKLPPEKLIVVSDDLELPCGKIRVRSKGSAGGHNGLKSIIQQIGSDAFLRVKIGIDRPKNPEYQVIDYVLGKFSADEAKPVAGAIKNAADACLEIVAASAESAAAKFNGLNAK
ncbi:MAG: aminoacyl-tRNA hydrolase [Clostridia bacterium]|nr:aminoacyl-tRNA hydrolase [Clostridia bacterium]